MLEYVICTIFGLFYFWLGYRLIKTGYSNLSVKNYLATAIFGGLLAVFMAGDFNNLLYIEIPFRGFIVSITEELIKFFISWICIRVISKNNIRNRIDYILVFGAVGISFALIENYTYVAENIGMAVFRSIFFNHMYYQIFMGMFYAEYIFHKKAGYLKSAWKNLLIALLIPVVIHGIWDYSIFYFVYSDVNSFIDSLLVLFGIKNIFVMLILESSFCVLTIILLYSVIRYEFLKKIHFSRHSPESESSQTGTGDGSEYDDTIHREQKRTVAMRFVAEVIS